MDLKNARQTPEEQRIVSEHLARFKSMQDERRPMEPRWKDITDYVYPRRSGWDFEEDVGSRAGELIFDGTAISAHRRLADGIFGWLVSPSIDWLEIVPLDRKFEDDRQVMIYCREVKEYLYEVFSRSNFYDAMAEDISDCSALGTSVLYIDEAKELGRPVYTPLHLREVYISENRYQEVDTLFRNFPITNRQLLETFGEKLDPALREMARRSLEEKSMLLHAMYPRMAANGDDIYVPKEKKAYASVYILQGIGSDGRSAPEGGYLLENGGTDYRHFEGWRFSHVSGQTYGTSPVMDAVFDTKMLNLQAKTMADVAQLAARPPMQAPESMRGRLRIAPGGVSYTLGDGEMKPVVTTLSYPFGIDSMERRAAVIRDLCKTDYFQMVSQIQNSSRQRTATEIAAMKSESAATLGSTVGRAQSERVDPVVRTTIAGEVAAGRFPKAPAAIQGRDIELKLRYVGPLAQAQRKYLRVEGITAGLAQALNFAQIDPDVVYEFKMGDTTREIAIANGFPQELLEDKATAQRNRKAAAQARAAMAAQEAKTQAMAAAASGAKAPEPGSMLDRDMRGGR